MADKVQLIKEEIEKYAKEEALKSNGSEFYGGRVSMCTKILSFINSLPEEHNEDLEEEMIRWHKEHFGNKRDWEKTSGEYLTRKSQLDIASHFAEWQKQKDMQDFLEKAERFIENEVSDYFWWNVEECFVDFDNETCLDDFKKYMEEN